MKLHYLLGNNNLILKCINVQFEWLYTDDTSGNNKRQQEAENKIVENKQIHLSLVKAF